MIRLLVFDFDGTLADTRDIVFNTIKNTLKIKGYDIRDEKILNEIGRAPLEITLRDIGVKANDVDNLAEIIKRQIKQKSAHIKSSGNIQIIGKIPENKIILSNNSSDIIHQILVSWKISFFKEVSGGDKFSSKYDKFKEILAKYKINEKEVAYFGDLDVDVNLAKKIGCYSVAVSNRCSWGTRADLIKAKPDFIIKEWNEVPHLIEKINSS